MQPRRRETAPKLVRSALTRLEALLGLVDHIDTATATNHAVIAMAVLERLQAVANLHVESLCPKLTGLKTEAWPLKTAGTQVNLALTNLLHLADQAQDFAPIRVHHSDSPYVGSK
jgi:hypothetical protein